MPTQSITRKPFSTDGKLGVDVTKAYTSQEFNLGERVCVQDPETGYSADYVFVKADEAIAQYAFVKIDDDFEVSEITTTLSGAEPTSIGCPQVALADEEYGFVAVKGYFTGLFIANCAADVKVGTVATAGYADDTVGDLIAGLKTTTLVGGSNASSPAYAAIDMATNAQD